MAPSNKSETDKIQELLKEYTELTKRQFTSIEPKDYVRYAINDELRYGGMVTHVKDDHLVLRNFAKRYSWTLDLKQPNLRLFRKKRA